MSQFHFLQKLSSLTITTAISAISTMAILFTPALGNSALAVTFTEAGEVGELIPDSQGPVLIPPITTIEGSLIDGGDIDLYELELAFDADVTIDADDFLGANLFLFDEIGQGLQTSFDELSFSGEAGDTFFLGINGTVALNAHGEPILDPSNPDFIGSGTLTSWVDPGIVVTVIIPYEVSITATPQIVPETSTILSLVTFGLLGIASTSYKKVKNKN